MIMELRSDITQRLTPIVLKNIRKAPKPTKVAEALAVAKELKGVAISLDEIAEVVNIAEPGRNIKARSTDYDIADLEKYPDLLLVKTPRETYVRYTGRISLYDR